MGVLGLLGGAVIGVVSLVASHICIDGQQPFAGGTGISACAYEQAQAGMPVPPTFLTSGVDEY
jgi:hypothetical protein